MGRLSTTECTYLPTWSETPPFPYVLHLQCHFVMWSFKHDVHMNLDSLTYDICGKNNRLGKTRFRIE